MDLSRLLADALASTTFYGGGGVSTPEDLRSTLADGYWGSPALRQALASRPSVPDHVVNPLIEALRDRLAPHLDVATDRVGHSFLIVEEGRTEMRIPLTGFSNISTRRRWRVLPQVWFALLSSSDLGRPPPCLTGGLRASRSVSRFVWCLVALTSLIVSN